MRSWQMSARQVVHEPSEDFELLAASVHNAWAKEALAAGRTDHPNLKPYYALPENVKEIDRATVRAVLDELCAARAVQA